jgi:hypothetical protein
MEFSLGIGSGFVAINSAGMAKKGAGGRQNDGKPAIKDSLIAIKESLIVRRRSGEIVVLGRFRVTVGLYGCRFTRNVSEV